LTKQKEIFEKEMVQMEQKINKRMKSSMLLSVHSKQRSNTGLGRASQAHSQASNASLSPDKNN
jgi:hypothetical protein